MEKLRDWLNAHPHVAIAILAACAGLTVYDFMRGVLHALDAEFPPAGVDMKARSEALGG